VTPVGYLLDEHTPTYWVAAVRRVDPGIRILRVGMPGAPPLRTPDPGLLRYCETNKLLLVTCDRRTMFDHIAEHTAVGNVFYGMLKVEGPITTEELVGDLALIHAVHSAEDFIDTVMPLPLRSMIES
jgi:hypothetical protein